MIITDSSFIYALFNKKETAHQRAVEFATGYNGEMIVPDVILPEVTFLFLRDIGYYGVEQFLEKFQQLELHLVSLYKSDLKRLHQISVQYASAEFDFVDMSIFVLAERLNIREVATFDRRDFTIMRPRHCDYFELLP